MTVAELIAELQKYPGHYLALLEVDAPNFETGGTDTDLLFVGDVEMQTNVGDLGPAVKIVSES